MIATLFDSLLLFKFLMSLSTSFTVQTLPLACMLELLSELAYSACFQRHLPLCPAAAATATLQSVLSAKLISGCMAAFFYAKRARSVALMLNVKHLKLYFWIQ